MSCTSHSCLSGIIHPGYLQVSDTSAAWKLGLQQKTSCETPRLGQGNVWEWRISPLETAYTSKQNSSSRELLFGKFQPWIKRSNQNIWVRSEGSTPELLEFPFHEEAQELQQHPNIQITSKWRISFILMGDLFLCFCFLFIFFYSGPKRSLPVGWEI